jgi:predicted kinase
MSIVGYASNYIFAHNFAILSYMKSLSLSQPHAIIMVGIPGSGKTFFAEKFADTFRAPYVSPETIADLLDTDEVSIDAVLQYQLGELLKTQQSIIIDGGGDTRAARAELARKARAGGYKPLLIWVQTDPVTAKVRSLKAKKPKRALTAETYDRLIERFSAPAAIEKALVISGKHTYATQAKVVLKKLSEPRTEISLHTAPPIRGDESPRRRNIPIR